MIRLRIQKSASEEDARNFDGGVYRPISAPLFMRGEPTHSSFSQLFLAIKTATYAIFLPKKENKTSKNERRVQQVDRAERVFCAEKRLLRIQDVDELSFGMHIWTWKNKKAR